MKTICWITGINRNYYNLIAKDTLKKWNILEGDKIIIVDAFFDEYSLQFPVVTAQEAYSLLDNKKVLEISTKGGKYFKFFKKAVCFWYGMISLNTKYDYIIWLDSDVIVEKEFSVESFLPDDDQLYSTILKTDRLPDSGFVAVNTRHENFKEFTEDYIDYYMSDKIKKLSHPWDAYIIEDYSKNVNIKNLWKNTVTDKSDFSCGFKDTMLEDYLTHYWGKKSKNTLIETIKKDIQ